jgi:hypothetical protein
MCCGRDRAQLRTTTSPGSRPANRPVNAAVQANPIFTNPAARVPFVYSGKSGMTVTGPVSGIQYSFDHPGSRVDVDPRDRVLLASLRQLKQVK